MSLDPIKKIAEAESAAARIRSEAALDAKRIIAEAIDSGEKALRDAKAYISAKSDVELQAAKDRAQGEYAKSMDSARAEADKVGKPSQNLQEKAIALIVERIVSA